MSQEIRDSITFLNAADVETIVLNHENGNVSLRGNLLVFNGDAHALRFDPATSLLTVGSSENDGHVFVNDDEGRTTFNLDGKNAILIIGTEDKDGNLRVRDEANRTVFDVDGKNAIVRIGAEGNEGDLQVQDEFGRTVFSVDGKNALVNIGTEGTEADLGMFDEFGRKVLEFNGANATLKVGAQGNEGDLQIMDNFGNVSIHADGETATLILGNDGVDGDLIVRDADGKDRVVIDGATGDIKLYGADCAEKFEVALPAAPGAVMVIDDQGKLRPSTGAYDHRVAGVVAGGGALRPGIILGHTGNDEGLLPIALTGRTYCQIDARFGAVAVGDLLTTSPTPGYAMKASDPLRAFGAVIGKAMRPLADGQGMIPILVALQ